MLENGDFLMYSWFSFAFAGVESSLSMDEVLQKRYRWKLEHWEVNLIEMLLLPFRPDRLARTLPPVTLSVEGSSKTIGE